jgi:tetratricopeptide (TPR) repeat protein
MLKEWFRELPNDPTSQQRELDSRMADSAQLRRANLLVAQDQLAAAAQGAQALTADPIYGAAAYELLGRIARLQHDDAGALAFYQQAVAADSERETALDGLARSHLLLGDDALAAAHWQDLLKLNDNSLAARAGLAWLWSTSPEAEFRSGARAVAMIEGACLSSPTPGIDALDALAAAYAECGRFEDALRVAEQAIVAARTTRDDARGDAAEARYALYLKSQPFRRPRMNMQGRQP